MKSQMPTRKVAWQVVKKGGSAALQRGISLELLGEQTLELIEVSGPSLARARVGVNFLSAKTALLHAHERPALDGLERPRDDGLERVGFTVSSGVPSVSEAVKRVKGDNLAAGDAVPAGSRFGPHLKAVSDQGLEIARHQPIRQEPPVGQRPPDLLRWVRQKALEHQ